MKRRSQEVENFRIIDVDIVQTQVSISFSFKAFKLKETLLFQDIAVRHPTLDLISLGAFSLSLKIVYLV